MVLCLNTYFKYAHIYKRLHDLLTNFSYLTNPIAFYNTITGLEDEGTAVDVALVRHDSVFQKILINKLIAQD